MMPDKWRLKVWTKDGKELSGVYTWLAIVARLENAILSPRFMGASVKRAK